MLVLVIYIFSGLTFFISFLIIILAFICLKNIDDIDVESSNDNDNNNIIDIIEMEPINTYYINCDSDDSLIHF